MRLVDRLRHRRCSWADIPAPAGVAGPELRQCREAPPGMYADDLRGPELLRAGGTMARQASRRSLRSRV